MSKNPIYRIEIGVMSEGQALHEIKFVPYFSTTDKHRAAEVFCDALGLPAEDKWREASKINSLQLMPLATIICTSNDSPKWLLADPEDEESEYIENPDYRPNGIRLRMFKIDAEEVSENDTRLSINDINTNISEGKFLMAAIAMLTTSEGYGNKEPDTVLAEVKRLASHMYYDTEGNLTGRTPQQDFTQEEKEYFGHTLIAGGKISDEQKQFLDSLLQQGCGSVSVTPPDDNFFSVKMPENIPSLLPNIGYESLSNCVPSMTEETAQKLADEMKAGREQWEMTKRQKEWVKTGNSEYLEDEGVLKPHPDPMVQVIHGQYQVQILGKWKPIEYCKKINGTWYPKN